MVLVIIFREWHLSWLGFFLHLSLQLDLYDARGHFSKPIPVMVEFLSSFKSSTLLKWCQGSFSKAGIYLRFSLLRLSPQLGLYNAKGHFLRPAPAWIGLLSSFKSSTLYGARVQFSRSISAVVRF